MSPRATSSCYNGENIIYFEELSKIKIKIFVEMTQFNFSINHFFVN